ncbi:hypothetical protein [uncultured Methylobacterium sp.]|uniref:hypothetical protein n=1 Tax=uncultured Methylobacterium sp. TaxID=157278 RepID=UPI0035CC5368
MSAIETRLAKIERARVVQEDSARLGPLKKWAAAGGPFSFVHGSTAEEYESRVALLRDAGAISPIDQVARMPFLPDTGKNFMRALFWRDFTDKERDVLRAAIRSRRGKTAEAATYARHDH